ncbi:uncharacterized protein SPSK_02034 [Sporothrix schenckii 1099-18]|uniref:Uncharacterized protein n=1 Tax=Sporothrix schenckii 1099-18 TaxID=1397361 RepID=A0A0F2ME58_SPOSC|nr:uncharacterized protein SPSK_02034 [Sporothrix schenckii 1099-18]KJR87389.1 hypothetical protein SPSK_02034 [Sporothrix schenckii 1099-18]
MCVKNTIVALIKSLDRVKFSPLQGGHVQRIRPCTPPGSGLGVGPTESFEAPLLTVGSWITFHALGYFVFGQILKYRLSERRRGSVWENMFKEAKLGVTNGTRPAYECINSVNLHMDHGHLCNKKKFTSIDIKDS